MLWTDLFTHKFNYWTKPEQVFFSCVTPSLLLSPPFRFPPVQIIVNRASSSSSPPLLVPSLHLLFLSPLPSLFLPLSTQLFPLHSPYPVFLSHSPLPLPPPCFPSSPLILHLFPLLLPLLHLFIKPFPLTVGTFSLLL